MAIKELSHNKRSIRGRGRKVYVLEIDSALDTECVLVRVFATAALRRKVEDELSRETERRVLYRTYSVPLEGELPSAKAKPA